MSNIDAVFHSMMGMSQMQRIALAYKAKTEIVNYAMKNGLDQKKANDFVVYYFRLFVAADAECDYRERELFNRTFKMELSQRQFEKLVGESYDQAFVDKMRKITQKMPEAVQNQVCTLGLVILCSDNSLTASEEKLLNKILSPEESLISRISPKK